MSVIKCILDYFKKHFVVFLFSIFIIVSVTILSLVPPQLLKIIVDDIIPSKDLSKLLNMLCFIC